MLGSEFEKNMAYIGCRSIAELSKEIFAATRSA